VQAESILTPHSGCQENGAPEAARQSAADPLTLHDLTSQHDLCHFYVLGASNLGPMTRLHVLVETLVKVRN
jgi:hypothetical protein